MKKTLPIVIATVILAAGNLGVWYILKDADPQISWIGFVLVWFNLILGWLTLARQRTATYLFFSISLILELILLIDKYWILGRGIL